MRAPNTHFEQVPVEVVKKIAGISAQENGSGSLSFADSRTKTEPRAPATQFTGGQPGDGAAIAASADECLKYPQWQRFYRDALIELDRGKLKQRIAVAETAISSRRRDIADVLADHEELQAIEDALAFLRLLKQSERSE